MKSRCWKQSRADISSKKLQADGPKKLSEEATGKLGVPDLAWFFEETAGRSEGARDPPRGAIR